VSSGRELVQEFKYRYEVDDFLERTQELFDNIQKDEFVSVLRHHAGLIAEDLFYVDTEGHNQIDFEMIGNLRDVVVPVLAETFKYIPVPRIERSDKNRAYWVDNIVLCGYDVLPDNVRFQIESDSEVSIRDIETKKSNTRMIITLSKIRTELKNLDFYYEKKTMPTLTEGGRVTLRLGGDGATLSFTFEVEQNQEDKVPRLVEGEVHFNIHKLDIEFDKESLKHDVLVPIMTTMFKQQIQTEIEGGVERSFKKMMKPIGEQLMGALSKVNRPILSGVSKVRDVVKGSQVGQVYEKRREKLE